METLRAALVQTRTPAGQPAAIDHLLPLLHEAAAGGAQLILTPEGSNLLQRDRARLMPLLVPVIEDPVVFAVQAFCARTGRSVVLGSVLALGEEGLPVNRQLVIGPDGAILAAYDKLHMFDVDLQTGERARESEVYAPGERAVVAAAAGAKLGLTICYDLRFPALHRCLAMAGAQVLTVPAAFTRPTGAAHWHVLLRARAIETGSFVLAPAQGGGHEDGRATYGHSLAVGPWGEVIGELPHDEPGVLIVDLDMAAVTRARAAIPALRHGRPFGLP